MSSGRQEQFTQQHERLWQQFEAVLDYQSLPWRHKRSAKQPEAMDLPTTYRQICQHYALANSRMYSPILVDRLNRMVVRGHQALYGSRSHFLKSILSFFASEFPQLVRQEWRVMLGATALFYVPLIVMIVLIQVKPELVFSVLDNQMVSSVESMYDPDNRVLGREREADSDLAMFGFYIRNNTSIGFQVFAGGMLFGIGTLFFMIFNGVYIGAVAGHLTHVGFIETFWGFVSGHSAFELTAIVISGAAGLKLAMALIAPGRKTRIRALIDNGKTSIKIMYGAVALFIMAAFVEAFWSSMTLDVGIKYAVAAALWSLVIAYFWLVGRGSSNAA